MIKYAHATYYTSNIYMSPSLPPSLSLGRFKSRLFCSYAILQCQEFLFRPEKVWWVCQSSWWHLQEVRHRSLFEAKISFWSFRENIFEEGEVGGHCRLDKALLREQGDHKSPLQSWYAELEEYTGLDFNPFETEGECDLIIDKPSIVIKLDAGKTIPTHRQIYWHNILTYTDIHEQGYMYTETQTNTIIASTIS